MNIRRASLHHEVLPFWAEYRRGCAAAPEILTLDFHTDVIRAAGRGIPDPAPGQWQCREAVDSAVKILRHDEHFDWALRSGIAAYALIVSLSPCAKAPEHPGIEVCRSRDLPELDVMLNAPEKFRPQAESVADDDFLAGVIGERLPDAGFILDIDCDYFMCANALFPRRHEIFDTLIRRAGLITLSEENDWVRVLKLPGENISGRGIADQLENRCYELVAQNN